MSSVADGRGKSNLSRPFGRFCVFGFALSALFTASPAWAQFYVRSPEVSKGELEIEEHGAFYSGANEEHLNSLKRAGGRAVAVCCQACSSSRGLCSRSTRSTPKAPAWFRR